MILRLTCFAFLAVAAPAILATDLAIQFPDDPEIAPRGDKVAFSWNGDLWDVGIRGGKARKLTSHPANDRHPVYSRDGRKIAFVSNRTGSYQVYVMPARGGQPERVTAHSEGYVVHDWFPDGSSVLCTGQRDHHWRDASRLLRVWVDGSRGEQVLADAAATSPSLSPDGKTILFNREGKHWWRKGYAGAKAAQVWMLNLETGSFSKLLSEGVDCFWPVWAPGGSSFYFARGGAQGFDLWRAEIASALGDADAKEVARVTTECVLDVDTHSVVFPSSSTSNPNIVYRHGFDLYSWNPRKSGGSKKIEIHVRRGAETAEDLARRKLVRAEEVAFHRDGLEVAFIAGGDVWVMDTELREPVQVTSTPEHETDLAWGPDGDKLWFVSAQDNQADIFRAERNDDREFWWRNTEFTIEQITDDPATESRLKFDPPGERMFYVRGNGELWSMDAKSLDANQHAAGFSAPDFDVSRDGCWLAYSQEDDEFNSDIFLAPVDRSQPPYNVSRHPDDDSLPRFSNDGKVLAFSSRRFEDETDICYVYLRDDLDDLTERDRRLEAALTKMKEQREPKVKKEESKKSNQTDTEDSEVDDVEQDAKDKGKKSKQSVEVNLDGIEDRVRRISLPNVEERRLVWVGDSQQLAFVAEINEKRGIYTISLPDKLEPKFLSSKTGSHIVWSDKAEALFLNSSGKPAKVDLDGDSESYGFSTVQEFSRSLRFGHAFDVAWRTIRDGWYDERLGGKNWDQVRRRYRPMAAKSVDSHKFETVVEMMLGELNGSHLGFSSSDDDRYEPPPYPDRTAHLGLRFVADHRGPGLKIRDVLPGSPADRDEISIEPGDLLLEVDGVRVDPAMDFPKVLNGLPQRDVRLKIGKVNSSDEETAEHVVRPSTYSAARRALYQKWVIDSRDKVNDQSDGKLGYLHIRSMNMESFNEFERQLYAAGRGKEGMVIDVRDNGGGWTTDYLLTALTQPCHAITIPRGGGRGYPQDRKVFASWQKPIVVLCNQNSFSNAEIFSHAIRTLGRGKLVGVPTGGGVISTGSVPITDVGRMRMPFRGWFVIGTGDDMELNGAIPDLVVWPEPGEIPGGIDRQLESAIRLLSEEVATQPNRPTIRYATEAR